MCFQRAGRLAGFFGVGYCRKKGEAGTFRQQSLPTVPCPISREGYSGPTSSPFDLFALVISVLWIRSISTKGSRNPYSKLTRRSSDRSSGSWGSLRSCEPEFLVSTPERLLELASLRAIDISGVSLLVMHILVQTLDNQTQQSVKMLVIAGDASKAQLLAISLKSECRSLAEDSTGASFTIYKDEKKAKNMVKEGECITMVDIEKFEIVVVVDFPSSNEDYVDILTRTARHSAVGVLHSFFCKADTPVAQPLIEVLMQCGQTVPEEIRSLGST